MNCGVCGGSEEAISPITKYDICNGEAVQSSGGANVQIPVPREREFGLRNPRKLQDPRLPSRKEVEDHFGAHTVPLVHLLRHGQRESFPT